MDTIKFYYKGELKGKADLPEATITKDRHKIAKMASVKIYDRMQFITLAVDKESGKIVEQIRMDTDDLKDKSFLNHELNQVIY